MDKLFIMLCYCFTDIDTSVILVFPLNDCYHATNVVSEETTLEEIEGSIRGDVLFGEGPSGQDGGALILTGDGTG